MNEGKAPSIRVGVFGAERQSIVAGLDRTASQLRPHPGDSEEVDRFDCVVVHRPDVDSPVSDPVPDDLPVIILERGDGVHRRTMGDTREKVTYADAIPFALVANRCTSLVRGRSSTRARGPRAIRFWTLWGVALATYGVGDLVTTAIGVFGRPGVVETNPIVASALESFGLLGFLAIKAGVLILLFVVSWAGRHRDDRIEALWPPVVATILGVALTLWNLTVIV